MEKRISFVQFQSVKSVAKAIDPFLRQKARLEAQIDGLEDEFKIKAEEELKKLKERLKVNLATKKEKLKAEIKGADSQIAAIEAGIVSIVGFHVTDLVKKVREPNDKGELETKYITTGIVTYDNSTREFVVTVPDEPVADTSSCQPVEADGNEESEASDVAESSCISEPQEEIVEETTDAPSDSIEAEETTTQMPWE